MMILSKPLKCFWNNRDICTNFWNYKLFAQYFRLNLAGCSLRILRICAYTKRLTREKDQNPLKIFKWGTSWNIGSPCFLPFQKSPRESFFDFIYWAKLNVFRGFFKNMMHTVKSYDCYFILRRYFSEYELVQTYETSNLQCTTRIG